MLIKQLRHWDTRLEDQEYFRDQNVLLPLSCSIGLGGIQNASGPYSSYGNSLKLKGMNPCNVTVDPFPLSSSLVI